MKVVSETLDVALERTACNCKHSPLLQKRQSCTFDDRQWCTWWQELIKLLPKFYVGGSSDSRPIRSLKMNIKQASHDALVTPCVFKSWVTPSDGVLSWPDVFLLESQVQAEPWWCRFLQVTAARSFAFGSSWTAYSCQRSSRSINVCSWDCTPTSLCWKEASRKRDKSRAVGWEEKGCSSGTLIYSCKSRFGGKAKKMKHPGYLQSVEKSLSQNGGACLSILKGMEFIWLFYRYSWMDVF